MPKPSLERDNARDDNCGAHKGRKQLQGFNDHVDRPSPISNISITGPPKISGRMGPGEVAFQESSHRHLSLSTPCIATI